MTGDILARFWTNDRFRATPDRVINGNGRERYAEPFPSSSRRAAM